MGIPVLAREASVPQGGIDLRHNRSPRRDLPAIERPEMDPAGSSLSKMAQPRNSGVGRLRHRALHVEMEDRFCSRADFCQAPPTWVARTSHGAAADAIPHKIDVDVVLVGGQWRWKSSRKSVQSSARWCSWKYAIGNEKPWSIPTKVNRPPDSSSASQLAIPRRVQYFRGLGGGLTSTGGAFRSATYTRKPLRLEIGVCAPE